MLAATRHLFRLLRDLVHQAIVQREIELPFLIVLLLATALMVAVGQAAAPFIYTLF